MISPRSFVYSRPPSTPTSSPSTSKSPSRSSALSPDYLHLLKHRFQRPPHIHGTSHSTNTSESVITHQHASTLSRRISAPKYENSTHHIDPSITPILPARLPTETTSVVTKMGKRKQSLEVGLAPTSPPREATARVSRPATPTSPVQIPKSSNRPAAHPQKRHSGQRRRPQNVQTPGELSPSVAALLAMTDIPRQRSQRRKRRDNTPLTVKELVEGQQVSEKELSWSLSRSPLDVLLSPPEEFADDDLSVSECNIGSALSTRTISMDSIPSLGDSFGTDGISSLGTPGTPGTPSPSLRGRKMSPMRRSLEPILSPSGEDMEHPLARKQQEVEVSQPLTPGTSDDGTEHVSLLLGQFKPLRYAFRSNLTASFKALRSAARSFSTINFPTSSNEDFLARSLLTIDTHVPYTDERRPPASEDIPSAEMRRYLNPMGNPRIESQLAAVPPPGTFSASIQMQTYKVRRSKLDSSKTPRLRASPQGPAPTSPPSEPQTAHSLPPGMRQREMRENPDFIRIAVMEMAMRKRGKLDDQKPGRARWALPPRKSSAAPYEIGPNGVPVRWQSMTYSTD